MKKHFYFATILADGFKLHAYIEASNAKEAIIAMKKELQQRYKSFAFTSFIRVE
jgi:DNA-binding winged helix-turn-helix (wHTH) protein